MEANLKREIALRPIRLKYKFTHENCFGFLLGLIWADGILITYARAVLIRIPYISDYREYIVSYVFLLALILSLPYMLKHVHPGVVAAYLLIASAYLVNMLLFPANQKALDENFVPFLIDSLPLMFVGVVVDLKKHYRMLYNISILSIIFRFVHLLIEPNNMINGDMYSSYLLLPHVCLVIAAALYQRNLLNISVSLVGVITILSFGTRGPILCMLVLVICYMILFKKIHKHTWFFCLVLISGLCVIFFYEGLVQVILFLIREMGMSTRIFDLLLSGEILATSGRDVLQTQLLRAVSDNWFGYGIAGDRAIVGTYAHNLLIELWVSYGVILGTLLFGVPFISTVIFMKKKSRYNHEGDGFILAVIASSYVKLFLSGTYLTESLLYLLIGILLSEYRASKKR